MKVPLYSSNNLQEDIVIRIIAVPHISHLLEPTLQMYRYTPDVQVKKLRYFSESKTANKHAFSDSKTVSFDSSECYSASKATALPLTLKKLLYFT